LLKLGKLVHYGFFSEELLSSYHGPRINGERLARRLISRLSSFIFVVLGRPTRFGMSHVLLLSFCDY